MTFEQLEQLRAIRAEKNAARERLLTAVMTHAEREVEVQHLVELTRRETEAQGTVEPAPPPRLESVAKLTPEGAAKRAAEIRAMPAYWRPSVPDQEGRVVTKEQHEALCRELVECTGRSLDAQGEQA